MISEVLKVTFHLNSIFNFTLYFSSEQNKGKLKSKSTCTCIL